MNRGLRFVVLGVLALAGMLSIVALVISAVFDPNDYKPLLLRRVQQDYGRKLDIPGRIELSFFPRIGVRVGAWSLSGRGAGEPFASARSARVSLALLPLLRGRLAVGRIAVDGLRLSLRRAKDGSTSIDDLLSAPAPEAAAPAEAARAGGAAVPLDIAGISLDDAAITFDDQMKARRVELTRLQVATGRIAPAVVGQVSLRGHLQSDRPLLDTDLALKGGLLFDPRHRRYAFERLVATLGGRVASLAGLDARLAGSADFVLEPLALELRDIEFSAQGQAPDGAVEASLALPRLGYGAQGIAAQPISARLSLRQGARSVRGQFASPAFGGSAQRLELPSFGGEVVIDAQDLHATVKLAGAVDGDAQHLASTRWTMTLDGKQGQAVLRGSVDAPWKADLRTEVFELPAFAADLALPNPHGGTLALQAKGSLRAAFAEHALRARVSGKLDQSSFDGEFGMSSFAPAAWRFDLHVDAIDADRYRAAARPAAAGQSAAPRTPIDVSALRDLDASGSLRVGTLRVARVLMQNLRLDMRARAGRIDIAPISADVYQGSLSGSASLQASTPPRIAVKQRLAHVAVGALLKDALGREPLAGRGDVTLDVTAQGTTPGALLKSLGGGARVALRDGAVRGFDVAQAIRSAKTRLGLASGAQAGAGSQAQTSDFSELSGSFRIADGVAHTEDLRAKSPLLRIAGTGDVDLAEGRLDCMLEATVVPTLAGQGGPELQALSGQTIPVRLKGPLTAIGYNIDVAALAKGIAKQQVEKAKEELKGKARQQLADKLKGLLGQ